MTENLSNLYPAREGVDPESTLEEVNRLITDKLRQSGVHPNSREENRLVESLPENVQQLYIEELDRAENAYPEIVQDPLRYIALPLVEANDVVKTVKDLINNQDGALDISFDWLSLFDPSRIDPATQWASFPQYLSKAELIREVKEKTGFRLTAELHDELSANQTQTFISLLLLDATDIQWY